MPCQQVTLVLKQPVLGIDAGIIQRGVGRGDLQVAERAQTFGGTRRDGRAALTPPARNGKLPPAPPGAHGKMRRGRFGRAGDCAVRRDRSSGRKAPGGERRCIDNLPGAGCAAQPIQICRARRSFRCKPRAAANSRPWQAPAGCGRRNSTATEFPESSAPWAQRRSGRRELELEIRNSKLAPNFEFPSFEFRIPLRVAANGRSAARAACCGK